MKFLVLLTSKLFSARCTAAIRSRIGIGRMPLLAVPLVLFGSAVRADDNLSADQIRRESGVSGGLVVHIGCDNPARIAALRSGDAYLVHGLDVSVENVNRARREIRSLGSYGPVSAAVFDGQTLPYADNLVNLMVVDTRYEMRDAGSEILRVLAPHGVAIVRSDGNDGWLSRVACPVSQIGNGFVMFTKPPPAEIDEWTHYLYDAGCNPVGRDKMVGPPKHLRWTAGPLWARNHGWTPSVSALVSAKGRLFYICDETPSGMDATVPAKWFVVARDAFSGVLLWKRPITAWGSAAFSGTPDDGEGVPATGRYTMPPHAARRLVAVDETVYVTLGPAAPVTALDARTGNVKREYAETAGTDEILVDQGRLILALNPIDRPRPRPVAKGEVPPPAAGKRICAVDASTGRTLWKKGPFAGIRATVTQDPYGRLELCAGDGMVFALTSQSIVCLDATSGATLWETPRPALPEQAVTRLGFAGYYDFRLETLSYSQDVVLLAQPEPNTHHTYHTTPGTLYAFGATTGKPMWRHAYGGWGHQTPPEVFVVDNLVWSHVNADAEFGSSWGGGYRAKDPSQVDYRIQALDLKTGDVVREVSTKDIFNVGHHHRCYRNRITERYLLSSRRGVEFVDLATGENYQNHWVRSGCQIGNLPCNGLLYVTPHPCGCYVNAKLIGFNALAAGRSAKDEGQRAKARDRLHKGPAFGEVGMRKSEVGIRSSETRSSAVPHSALRIPHSQDWPTYRHDPMRTGGIETAIGANLQTAWETPIGAKPSAVTVSDGKVFVSAVDAHTVHALDAADGTPLWQYTVDARVDSPPTVDRGRILFGTRAGRVYCLRAADGVLVWRFDAAPYRKWIAAFGQLESPWPVPGNVLVQDGKCWFAAGRSSYLDGGIHVVALDPATGDMLHEQTIYSPEPKSEKMAVETDAQRMTGLLNDIPGSDGRNVFVRQQRVSSGNDAIGPHLFSTAGYLDSTWFNRTFWSFGEARATGLLVLGDGVAFGVEPYHRRGANDVFSPGAGAYRLWCAPLKSSPTVPKTGRNRSMGRKPIWEQRPEIRITAMLRAGDKLFVAGCPDVVDPQDPHGAWEGRKGGRLAAFDTRDGRQLAAVNLPAPPVWDGMAAAFGGLYIPTEDGTVRCLRAVDR